MPVLTETTDAAAGTSTPYSMAVGDYFYGTLGLNDADWVAVTLQAGQTYTFGLTGIGALNDGVADTVVRLYDSTGALIDSNDDGGPGTFSNLTYTAARTETYYVSASAWQPLTDAGDYGVSVTLGNKASYDVMMGAGVLLRPDASWAGAPGTGVTVTWAIRASGPAPDGAAYDAGGNKTPYIPPSAAQIAAMQGVMALFDGLSGLTLTQVSPGAATNNATMLVGAYNSTADGAGAFAYYPGSTEASSFAGDVWMNNASVSQTSLPPGTFSHFALLHEVGHAVGLAHPGDYNAAPGLSITYANNAQFIEDTHQYTVMSYFDESNTTTSFSSYPDTLLLYDIHALHQQYGADFSYHAGNTTYGFNATVGGAYDFTTNTDPVLSIWDGSGTDTLDLSGYGMAQVVDLRAGQFSNIGSFVGNLSIAVGAVIENAVGGSGNDTITGNSADNRITGGIGSDTFMMALNRAQATVTQIAGGYRVVSALGTDTLIGVEFIQFTDQLLDLSIVAPPPPPSVGPTSGGDTLTGTSGDDVIDLLAGDDVYEGLAGDDTVTGGSGTDTVVMNILRAEATVTVIAGGHQVVSSLGTDTLLGVEFIRFLDQLLDLSTIVPPPPPILGGAGNDTLDGTSGNDVLSGLQGDDVLNGNVGDDTLIGGIGADTMDGGAGTDVASYADSTGPVGARLDGGGNWQAAAGDVILNTEGLIGSDHDDTLVGNDLANLLQGGAGTDTIYGLGGNDTLEGGAGDDLLYGQRGANILRGNAGRDRLFGGSDTDTLEGGADDDFLNGLQGADRLDGGIGNDTMIGGDGADTLDGGAGVDAVSYAGSVSGVGVRLDGVPGWGIATGDVLLNIETVIGTDHRDIIVGSAGANLLQGGGGDDKIYALAGDDTVEGGSGDDRLFGQEGADTLIGGDGADTLDGGAGVDAVSYAGSVSGVGVRLDGVPGWGIATGDVLLNIETVIGTDHRDIIVGSAGANLLQGGGGDDKIYALAGDDTVEGGAGADDLYGQSGNDSFVFADGFGTDAIWDFNALSSAETINLSAVSTLTSYVQLTTGGRMVQQGADVLIDDLSGNTILVKNVTLGDLGADDFVFGV